LNEDLQKAENGKENLHNLRLHSNNGEVEMIGWQSRQLGAVIQRRLCGRTLCSFSNSNFQAEKSSKYFEFQRLEQEIYGWWETEGYFKPIEQTSLNKAAPVEPFVMTMPPPNVTGKLHVGHALFVALQDVLARFHRMRGRPTLWLPGTDHAGIATQLLVERQLQKEGLIKEDLGREGFVKRVWEWKEEHGGHITRQLRRLGASADWSREKFTLDSELCGVVTEAFIRLHEKGLVYRGSYMVNWSPSLQTALSDLEVEFSEEEGVMYYFKYELCEEEQHQQQGEGEGQGRRFIPVATTRPETILGDTAVCVHPEDSRYRDLIGKQVRVPLSGGRTVPGVCVGFVPVSRLRSPPPLCPSPLPPASDRRSLCGNGLWHWSSESNPRP
jgi:valyl-tRNA synthetase